MIVISQAFKRCLQVWWKRARFDETVGELAYNLIDLGVSVHGKFKLIPKLKEYGNPIRKLFCYSRKDLEMAYKQMGNKLLAEVLGDVILCMK